MTVLGDVFASLQRMTLIQLLFGFLAFTGYAFAQGSLFGPRLRTAATALALLSAAGFALAAAQWVLAVMLLTFGIAGMGLFAGAVWLISDLLGLRGDRMPVVFDSSFAEPQLDAIEPPTLGLPTPRVGTAHSH